MTNWVCKNCGTINEDILDMRNLPIREYNNSYRQERIKRETERRNKYEIKGEIPPIPCEHCGELRIMMRVK